jgi:hypothetical protein
MRGAGSRAQRCVTRGVSNWSKGYDRAANDLSLWLVAVCWRCGCGLKKQWNRGIREPQLPDIPILGRSLVWVVYVRGVCVLFCFWDSTYALGYGGTP